MLTGKEREKRAEELRQWKTDLVSRAEIHCIYEYCRQYDEQYETAKQWLRMNEWFQNTQENIALMQQKFIEKNLPVTIENMTLVATELWTARGNDDRIRTF